MLCTRVKGSCGKRAPRKRSMRIPASSGSTVRVCTPLASVAEAAARCSRRVGPAGASAGGALAGSGFAKGGLAKEGFAKDGLAARGLSEGVLARARGASGFGAAASGTRFGRGAPSVAAPSSQGERSAASSPRLRAARCAASLAEVRGPVPARGANPLGPRFAPDPRCGGRPFMCRCYHPEMTAQSAAAGCAAESLPTIPRLAEAASPCDQCHSRSSMNGRDRSDRLHTLRKPLSKVGAAGGRAAPNWRLRPPTMPPPG